MYSQNGVAATPFTRQLDYVGASPLVLAGVRGSRRNRILYDIDLDPARRHMRNQGRDPTTRVLRW